MGVKAAAIAAITQDAFIPLWRSLVNELVVVFMLHRFSDDERESHGATARRLRANLEFLRRHRFDITSLDALISGKTTPPGSGPSIVFTVDDGYADFASVAAPIFAEFDCPVTVFLVTDAIDQTAWFWWDRVEYTIESGVGDTVDLSLSTHQVLVPREQHGNTRRAVAAVTDALKNVADDEKENALALLAEQLRVDVPAAPPARYAAMTWSDVRRCAGMGATFGPHTVRHPMLTQIDAARARAEVNDSWTRLCEKCEAAVPVFCYPNGTFTSREVDILAEGPFRAAVTTVPDYATRDAFSSTDPSTRFRIPRFAYSEARERFVQVVAGVERFKDRVRSTPFWYNSR